MLVNVGASVTKRIRPAPLLRDPDVIVTDSRAPRELCEVRNRIRPAPLLRDPDVIVTDSRAPREVCEVYLTGPLPHAINAPTCCVSP